MQLQAQALSIVTIFLGALWSFAAAMHAKKLWPDLTIFWKVVLVPLAVIGVVLDIAFNWTVGWTFLEARRLEFLFSSRVQRVYSTRQGWRLRYARWWARQLNVMDPGHIRDTRRFR